MKEFNSSYLNIDLKSRVNRARKSMAFGLFVMTILIIGYFKISYGNDDNSLTKISNSEWLYTGLFGASIAIISVLLSNKIFNKRPLIVGFKFDDEKEELTLKTKTIIDPTVQTIAIQYAKLRTRLKESSDGFSGPSFNCLAFYNDDTIIGFHFKKHEMWKVINEVELEKYLKRIL